MEGQEENELGAAQQEECRVHSLSKSMQIRAFVFVLQVKLGWSFPKLASTMVDCISKGTTKIYTDRAWMTMFLFRECFAPFQWLPGACCSQHPSFPWQRRHGDPPLCATQLGRVSWFPWDTEVFFWLCVFVFTICQYIIYYQYYFPYFIIQYQWLLLLLLWLYSIVTVVMII